MYWAVGFVGAFPPLTHPTCALYSYSWRCALFARPPSHAKVRRNYASGICASAGDESMDVMRARLEGLFGASDGSDAARKPSSFDGNSLRKVIRDRFTVEVRCRVSCQVTVVLLRYARRDAIPQNNASVDF
jgi:hypothetical protein